MIGSVVQIGGGRCVVQPIAADGNCLFGAISHQLFRLGVHTTEHHNATSDMRRRIVTHLESVTDNEELNLAIKARVFDDFPELLPLNDILQRASFLRLLRGDGVWGGVESLVAITVVYNREIVIYRENGFSTTVRPYVIPQHPPFDLVYRGPAGEGYSLH